MSGFICAKPCRFGTADYYPGDLIPDGVVMPQRVKKLIAGGYIARMPDGAQQATVQPVGGAEEKTIIVPIYGEKEVLELDMRPQDVVQAISIMQKKTEEAVAEIDGVASDETLILIHKLDNRKTVRDAAQTKANAIKEQAGGGKAGDA